jgi:hypothetical protein
MPVADNNALRITIKAVELLGAVCLRRVKQAAQTLQAHAGHQHYPRRASFSVTGSVCTVPIPTPPYDLCIALDQQAPRSRWQLEGRLQHQQLPRAEQHHTLHALLLQHHSPLLQLLHLGIWQQQA